MSGKRWSSCDGEQPEAGERREGSGGAEGGEGCDYRGEGVPRGEGRAQEKAH